MARSKYKSSEIGDTGRPSEIAGGDETDFCEDWTKAIGVADDFDEADANRMPIKRSISGKHKSVLGLSPLSAKVATMPTASWFVPL